jgi:hypothetical protein
VIYLDTSVLGAIFFREPGAVELVARLEHRRKAKLTFMQQKCGAPDDERHYEDA